jgi:hypothetical protein
MATRIQDKSRTTKKTIVRRVRLNGSRIEEAVEPAKEEKPKRRKAKDEDVDE